MNALIETAYDWQQGLTCSLRRFHESGGIVVDDEHREALMSEIDSCIDSAGTDLGWPKAEAEENRLERLRDHVEAAELGKRLERL